MTDSMSSTEYLLTLEGRFSYLPPMLLPDVKKRLQQRRLYQITSAYGI